ncbi:MAG: serine/threonine-protein kinase [Acidobacteria bacterium]|nr:serine/threonine-protein kinase [Acidobacteriota bacterium]
MPLPAGTRLGPYEIGPALGAGGMGEVYRARDTRLDRDVAVKLLPAGFSREPGARERFDREARLISRLSHPHICSVFDVGEHDGAAFIVMEYLEGETLAWRLQRGALPVAQALRIATDVADALYHAHRHGIVHRDLKPGNVMLTRSGAKLLDFGVAKAAVEPAGPDGAAVTIEPLTRAGVIVGTPQYMAPEQVRGHPTDHRTDIFAFGALLQEVITGRRAFDGPAPSDVMAAILNVPVPAVSTLQPLAPPALDHVVARCLEKDPDERWQSAFDVASELRWIANTATSSVSAQPTAAAISMTRRLSPLVIGICGLLAGAAVYAGVSALVRQAPQVVPEIIRAVVPLPPNAQLAAARPSVAISPDGRFLAFVASVDGASRLFVRSVDAFEMTPVRGTEAATGPFFSPNGEWIGFFANGRLMKVSRAGGTPVAICEATDVRGATWGTDDTIVFSPRLDAGLYRVSAAGGAPVAVTVPAAERREKTHRFPEPSLPVVMHSWRCRLMRSGWRYRAHQYLWPRVSRMPATTAVSSTT